MFIEGKRYYRTTHFPRQSWSLPTASRNARPSQIEAHPQFAQRLPASFEYNKYSSRRAGTWLRPQMDNFEITKMSKTFTSIGSFLQHGRRRTLLYQHIMMHLEKKHKEQAGMSSVETIVQTPTLSAFRVDVCRDINNLGRYLFRIIPATYLY